MFKCLATAVVVLATSASFAQPTRPSASPILITADLSEAPRKIFHAEVEIPVKPGPLTLITPKWIPGNHRPTGPVDDITGVVFSIDGKPIPWRRDDVDLYEFHMTIPAGATILHAHLDCIATERVSQKIAVLEWEKLLLYPAHTPVKDIPIQPSVTVPAGWGIGTALTVLSTDGVMAAETGVDESFHGPTPGAQTTHYAATTVEQLEDSPVISGQYFHEFPLAPEVTPKHYIDVVADAPEDSNLRPALLAELANLVRETGAIYGARHYNVYHFLLTLSDVAGNEGLEHGQSSDNGLAEHDEVDDAHQLADADLYAHEYTHSWNGKYRRPYNLYQPDFNLPEEGSLLWVYEGMTQYLGNILAARSGLKSQAHYRDLLALSAATLQYKSGREWRSTEDTAIAASVLRALSPAWANWRRGQDYYQEGELFWLDADTLIRKTTDNKKSLDDFQRLFLGKGGNTGPLIVTYTRADLIHDLNQVMPYDWAKFIHERIDDVTPKVDLDGIERGGYKLVFQEKPNDGQATMLGVANRRAGGTFWFSIGLSVTGDGTIGDVRWGGPGDAAKLSPGMKIIAVNGQVFSAGRLHDAIKEAKGKSEPIHLITQADTFIHMYDLNYHDGERYPALQRIDGAPAYLDDITKPLTTPVAAK
jgi:predicted metalloprotease with PDZ domain